MAHENSQFETDRRLKHPWNSGVVAADVRLTAGKLLLDQSILAGEPVPQRSRVDPAILVLSICRRLGPGRSLRHESAFVAQIALLIAAATANRACPCKWSRSPGHSSYTRRFFVDGLTAAFDTGELYFFANLTDLEEARTLSARKACGRRRPHLMKSPEIVTLASSFLAIGDVADQ